MQMPEKSTNEDLIARFYSAFQNLDAESMSTCYAPDVRFEDPAFGPLHGREVSDMWRMLLGRADDFSLAVENIKLLGQTATADATASYTYSATGRFVVNVIQTRFAIRDGLIAEQTDTFDLWRWSRQALGINGWLLGWSPKMHEAIRTKARRALKDYQKKQAAA